MKSFIILGVSLLVGTASIVGEQQIIKGNSVEEETFEIVAPLVKSYLQAETSSQQFAILYNYSNNSSHAYYDKPVLPVISFDGDGVSPYRAFISNDGFETYETISTKEEQFTINAPIPGETYEYEVVNAKNKVIKRGKAHISDEVSLRQVNMTSTWNTRDMGGWNTESGYKVKYGYLYRGGQINGSESLASEEQLNFYKKTLGIKTEIDYRCDSDDGGQTGASGAVRVFGGYDITYMRDFENAYQAYDATIYSRTTRISVAKIFAALADESNYPFYTHCAAGADRTGTTSLIMEAALGVGYDDLIRDFELTSFSSVGNRWRSAPNSEKTDFDNVTADTSPGMTVYFPQLLAQLKKFGDESSTMEDRVVSYLTKSLDDGGCGVPMNDINSFRAICLGLERKTDDQRNVNETCTTGGVAVYEYEGEDIIVETKPLNHKFICDDDHAICTNCHKSYLLNDIDIDVTSKTDFGSNIQSVTLPNGEILTANKGLIEFEARHAYEEPVLITANYSDGKEVLYKATIYSKFIKTVDDLLSIADSEAIFEDFSHNYYSFGNYLLANDITLPNGTVWTKDNALGYKTSNNNEGGFIGVFNGNGHTISNFVTSGQDGALIYALTGGKVCNLTLKGKSNDAYWGSDFLVAYSHCGTIDNVNIEVALGGGTGAYHSTALLGSIGYGEDIDNKLVVNDVTITNTGSEVAYSCSLGSLFRNSENSTFNNYLKLNNVTTNGFNNAMVTYDEIEREYVSLSTVEEVSKLVGATNINNLVINL